MQHLGFDSEMCVPSSLGGFREVVLGVHRKFDLCVPSSPILGGRGANAELKAFQQRYVYNAVAFWPQPAYRMLPGYSGDCQQLELHRN